MERSGSQRSRKSQVQWWKKSTKNNHLKNDKFSPANKKNVTIQESPVIVQTVSEKRAKKESSLKVPTYKRWKSLTEHDVTGVFYNNAVPSLQA